MPCQARVRYNGEAVPASVRVLSDVDVGACEGAAGAGPSGRTGRFEVRFDAPERAVAPGQAVVLYDAAAGEHVLGGGWIRSAIGTEEDQG